MRHISVKDAYYKIEDKWFDFLDSLDTKGVPIYKVIDPIEKTGVPSFPIFIALLLIILYLLVGGISIPSFGGKDISFTLSVFDSQTEELLSQGEVAIYSEKAVISSGELEEGKYTFSAKKGTYYINVSSTDCTEITGQEIEVSDDSTSDSVSLECVQRFSREVTICFQPASIGTVNMKVNDNEKTSQVQCESGSCKTIVKGGQTFTFSSQNDLLSNEDYTAQELIDMEESSRCVMMIENPSIEKANTIVLVNDANNTPIGGLTVMLINPNTSVEMTNSITGRVGNNTGKADFSSKLLPGQSFKIKVNGGANTSTYFDPRVFNATKDLQVINVTVQYASPTQITTIEKATTGGEKGLSGVFVKATNGAKSESGYTNSNGSLVMGLENNLKYRTTFWKEGYEYQTATVTGGVNNTAITMIKMEKNPDGFYTKAGDLMIYLTFDDKQPVTDAEITLYNGTDDTGIPQQKDAYDGDYLFKSMPPGTNYYVIIKRSSFQSERIKINEIKAGAETYQEISIKKQVTKIITSVTVDGESSKDETRPNVYIIDLYKDEANQQIMTKMVDTRGRADFDIPEGTNMNVLVKYTKDNKIYDRLKIIGDIDQYVMENGNTISIDLTPLVLDIKLMNITESSDSTKSPSGRLNPGDVYNYIFSIGTPKNNGEAWDSITINLNDTGTVAYEFNDIIGLEDTGYISMTGSQTSNAKITISEGYTPDMPIEFTVPVRIKQVQRDLVNKSFKYNATWIGETSVTKGYETPKFNISSMKCVPIRDGTFTICTSYEREITACIRYNESNKSQCLEYGPQTEITANLEGPQLEYNQSQTMRVEYIYEGTGIFSGSVGLKVNPSFKNVIMGPVNITKNRGTATLNELSSSDYTIAPFESIITTGALPNTMLERGQSIVIKTNVKALGVPRAIFNIRINSANAQNTKGVEITPNFNITGNVQAKITAPFEIYDLSDSIEINVSTDNFLQRPIAVGDWEREMSITGLTGCTLNNVVPADNYPSIIESKNNMVKINFTNGCKVSRSASELTIILPNIPDAQIKGVTKSIPIKRCASPEDATKAATAQFQLECKINVETSYIDGGMSVPQAGFCTVSSPATYIVKVAEACEGATYYIKEANIVDKKEIDYLTTTANNLKYTYGIAPSGRPSVEKEINVTLIGNNSNGASYEERPIKMTVQLQYDPPAETIEGFRSLDLQKYNQPINCENNYCTLQQAFLYLGSDPSTGYNVKLVRNIATQQEIMEVWKDATGKEVKILQPADILTNAYNYLGSVVNPLPGTNAFTFTRGEGYSILESISNVNGDVDKERAAETSGMQLRMPALNKTFSNAIMQKWSTDIINTTNAVNSSGSNAVPLLKNAIALQWNTAENYVDIDGASQKAILAVCNESNIDSEECEMLQTFTGSKTNVPIAIFSAPDEDKLNTVYFIGTSVNKLVEAVRRFNETINGGSASLIMANYTNGDFERKYLTRPSNSLRFQCVNNGAECSGTLFDSSFNESLKAIGAKETGYAASEINLVKDSSSYKAYIAICSDKSKCMIGTNGISFNNALLEMGITDPLNFEVPTEGILISKCNSLNTQYMAYATSMDGIKSALANVQTLNNGNCKMPQDSHISCPIDQTSGGGGLPASQILNDPSVAVYMTFNTTTADSKGGIILSSEVGSKGYEWNRVVKGQAIHYDTWCPFGDCGGGMSYYANTSKNYTIGTVSAWTLPEYFDEPNLYIAKIIDSNGQELDLLLGNDNGLNLFKCRLANASKIVELTKAVTSSTEITGKYNQITCSIGKGVMNLYVNGMPVNSTAITGVRDYMNMSAARSGNVMFFNRDITKEGNWDGSTTDSDLRGFIDEVVFLNRSITNSEAQALYRATGGV